MTSRSNAYVNALLADATYALDSTTPNGINGSTLSGRIKLAERMTPTLANYNVKPSFSQVNLAGLGGNDTLDGGTGDDVILGGLGADQIKGGEGNDIILANVSGYYGGDNNTVDNLGRYTANVIHTNVGDSGLFRWDVNQDAQGTLQLAGFVAANQEKFSCAA